MKPTPTGAILGALAVRKTIADDLRAMGEPPPRWYETLAALRARWRDVLERSTLAAHAAADSD